MGKTEDVEQVIRRFMDRAGQHHLGYRAQRQALAKEISEICGLKASECERRIMVWDMLSTKDPVKNSDAMKNLAIFITKEREPEEQPAQQKGRLF